MKKHIIVLSLILAGAAGCTVAELDGPKEKTEKQITITATREGATPDTKTVRDESNGAVLWAPGDRISLFYGSGTDGGSMFTAQNQENANVTNFTGTIGVITGGADISIEDTYFWGIYPYSEDVSCDGTSVTLTLSDQQEAVPGTFATNLFPSIGRSSGLNMGFYNVCGGLKIQVQKEGIKKVTLHSNDGPIAGRARIVLNSSGVPSVAEILDGKEEIVLEAPAGQYLEPGKNYYFVMYPHAFESRYFTLTFETYLETGTYERKKPLTINRSVFEGFSVAIDKNVVYEEKTGNIPIEDAAFKTWLIGQGYDTDGDGEISFAEAKEVRTIEMQPSNEYNLQSLRGIEYMPNLESILCSGEWYDTGDKTPIVGREYYYVGPYENSWDDAWGPIGTLKYVDVTNNPKLERLQINDNSGLGEELDVIDLTRNPLLRELHLGMTWLRYPDISHNLNLEYFNCSHLRGSLPDFSGHDKIKTIFAEYPQGEFEYEDLDVSDCPDLEVLYVCARVRSLSDLSANPNLKTLYCDYNPISELNLSQNSNLEVLSISGTDLSSIDISHNPNLTAIFACDNNLTTLNTSSNPILIYIHCWNGQINSLDVTDNPALEELLCWNNNLQEIDVTQNPSLRLLCIAQNQLTDLNVSQNPDLEELSFNDNSLSMIDVSNNTKLLRLNCWNNHLTDIELSQNPALTMLRCWGNQIRSLNVSNNLLLGTGEDEWTGLWCSPMNDNQGNNLLEILYVAADQVIPFVTENRSTEHIPAGTSIQLAVPEGGSEGTGDHENEP